MDLDTDMDTEMDMDTRMDMNMKNFRSCTIDEISEEAYLKNKPSYERKGRSGHSTVHKPRQEFVTVFWGRRHVKLPSLMSNIPWPGHSVRRA
jgi:hypothetical protein